jgi:hypothetical protein
MTHSRRYERNASDRPVRAGFHRGWCACAVPGAPGGVCVRVWRARRGHTCGFAALRTRPLQASGRTAARSRPALTGPLVRRQRPARARQRLLREARIQLEQRDGCCRHCCQQAGDVQPAQPAQQAVPVCVWVGVCCVGGGQVGAVWLEVASLGACTHAARAGGCPRAPHDRDARRHTNTEATPTHLSGLLLCVMRTSQHT